LSKIVKFLRYRKFCKVTYYTVDDSSFLFTCPVIRTSQYIRLGSTFARIELIHLFKMRYFALLTLCLVSFNASAQRILSGKVIEEFDLTPMPGIRIMTKDTVILATTDLEGNFNIQLPRQTDTLLLAAIGMEWTLIGVPTNCNRLEIIMMSYAIYDFITVRAADKKRFKRFKGLHGKHKQAFDKGIFDSATPCVSYIFEKYAPGSVNPR